MDGERRANRALRVVVVRLRDAEHGEDRVADELLDRPPVSLDLAVDQLEELTLEPAELLWIEPLGERRGACEVGEEDGDDAALLPVVRDRRSRRLLM